MVAIEGRHQGRRNTPQSLTQDRHNIREKLLAMNNAAVHINEEQLSGYSALSSRSIDINRLSRIDTSKSTFTVDFYVWLHYFGDNDAAE